MEVHAVNFRLKRVSGKFPGRTVVHLIAEHWLSVPPLSTYSAQGVLRQGPLRGAESPTVLVCNAGDPSSELMTP